MNWRGENQAVSFAAQPGDHRSGTMPAAAPVNWTMENAKYAPAVGNGEAAHQSLGRRWARQRWNKNGVGELPGISGKTSDD